MDNHSYISQLLSPYEPQCSVEQLITEVNVIFHNLDGEDYDVEHPEIKEQLPRTWKQMLDHVIATSNTTEWRILDFGCGTGFEAAQVLSNLPKGKIAALTCYDPSSEMLNKCRAKLTPLFSDAQFFSSLEEVARAGVTYNLLLTNSVLHHLPDVSKTLDALYPNLSPDCVWLSGHEPSSRFYKNPQVVQIFDTFYREYKWRRLLSPRKYLEKLSTTIGVKKHPLQQTASEAFVKGLFAREPSAYVIGRLVDFHVAHSKEEVAAGRGFDFELLQEDLAKSWKLDWVKTYSFMGYFYEGDLPAKWQRASRELAQKFPNDGANFCAIWKRIAQ
jgi:ubiquinone/menaquinone biosynthesis C-methylase UbiE